jgi:hypothetical protein
LPLLKKESGFVEEILLFESSPSKAGVGLCFWKNKEEAEHYRTDVFPKAKDSVQNLLNGVPTIRGFEVEAAETLRIASGKAA